MNRKQMLLLIVNAGAGKPLTPVQLQKSVFLVGESGLADVPQPFYEFEPYDYGPFDVAIYHDADFLQQEGLVTRVPSPTGTWTDTTISVEGQQSCESLKTQIPKETVTYISEIVAWVQNQTFRQLIANIYKLYPAYRENSVFQG